MSEPLLYGDFQPEDVLDGELPARPEGLEPGDWFPLARWQDERFGAVFYVYRNYPEDIGPSGDEFDEEIEIVEREGSEWGSGGSGGGDFVDPFHVDADWLRSRVVVDSTTGLFGSDFRIDVVGGLCSPQVEWVEVDDAIATPIRTRVDSPMHAFLVGVYGGTPTTIRLLDASGEPLRRFGRTIEWRLG